MIQLNYFLGGIHHCVLVVRKWIFDSNFAFEFPLTREKNDYYFINDNKTKVMNGYKGLLKAIMFFTVDNNKSVFHK